MAAVHRLVLTRRAPALALHYPSVGGTATDLEDAGRAFLDLVEARPDELRELAALHGLTLTTWPGGAERVLARCGAHGADVVWRP